MIELDKLPEGTTYFRLPIYSGMKFSLNEVTKHWTIRKKMVDSFHLATKQALMSIGKVPKYTGRVDLIFRFFWKTKALDPTNTAFMAKSCEDALVTNNVMKKDTNQCVRWIHKESVLLTTTEIKQLPYDMVDVYIVPVEEKEIE